MLQTHRRHADCDNTPYTTCCVLVTARYVLILGHILIHIHEIANRLITNVVRVAPFCTL